MRSPLLAAVGSETMVAETTTTATNPIPHHPPMRLIRGSRTSWSATPGSRIRGLRRASVSQAASGRHDNDQRGKTERGQGPNLVEACGGEEVARESLREIDRSMEQDRDEDAASGVVEDPRDDDREAGGRDDEHADARQGQAAIGAGEVGGEVLGCVPCRPENAQGHGAGQGAPSLLESRQGEPTPTRLLEQWPRQDHDIEEEHGEQKQVGQRRNSERRQRSRYESNAGDVDRGDAGKDEEVPDS